MLQKTPVNINFAQGLDTKTDPFQVQVGKFLDLKNSVFDKAGRLTKRNGFAALTALPDPSSILMTTFNGGLTALGASLQSYSDSVKMWSSKGTLQLSQLGTLPLVRSNTNQSQADAVIASNGLVCTVYTDNVPSGGSNVPILKYVIADSDTGQNVIAPTIIQIPGMGDPPQGAPRVYLLGVYFLIVYTTVTGGDTTIKYIAISITDPSNSPITGDITTYTSTTTVTPVWEAAVYDNILYIAYALQGSLIAIRAVDRNLVVSTPRTFTGASAAFISVSVDSTNPASPIIYVSYSDSVGGVFAVSSTLGTVLAPTTAFTGATVSNITSVAHDGLVDLYYQVVNTYSYGSSAPTDYVGTVSVTQAGTVGTPSVVVRSVGLASKGFRINGANYFLGVYSSPFQPTYFLFNGSGQVTAKLAYSNAGPYLTTDAPGLPNVTVNGTNASIVYLFKDLVQAVNKTQGLAAASAAGVYAQLGVNLVTFTIAPPSLSTAEIGSNLNITGGFVTAYDGYSPVEQGFFLYPDNVFATVSATGGSLAQQQYFYQVTYEWADNQGNLFRSAPSIPLSVNVASGGGAASVTLDIPTLRVTYKTANPVKIVIYRWSAVQQIYYQVTSILIPTLNDTTADSISYVDTLADASILGNNIIYTTGGVLENIAPPAALVTTLFNNRLWIVDSEDRNLLWFSKQVIESTPVEMSDLQTLYIAPATSSQSSTGPMTSIFPMDDKLIIFKRNALGYINGIGPDITNANSSYSDFVLINSVVGCTNQNSIVLTPAGLMFESEKGIWLLGRDLSTSYIGAPVETFTTGTRVLSAINVPDTNQVRFSLNNGITLMYDYYYSQWGTFVGVPSISNTVYQNLHTYLNKYGQVLQESAGKYLDNTSPVLMGFTTSWFNLSGLQGFERFYQALLLGTYITPFKLNVQLSYDYSSSPQQSSVVSPNQKYTTWGSENLWGGGKPWGGSSSSNVFEARLFPKIQKCESFQIVVDELFDPTITNVAGAGLTLSGLNLVVGMKKGFRTSSASRSFAAK